MAEPEMTAPAKETVKETVVVEKEVEKPVTKIVEKEAPATPLPAPTPTAVPTASPTPQPAATAVPTASPVPAEPTPTPAVEPEPPPPLLGQYVPETILWLPEAVTDASGHLELDIPLLDVPATWRLTVLASTLRGELGAGTEIIAVE
jgi:hypothetical protein